MTGESKRQIEHILPLAFAFLLRYLTVTQAVVCCLAAALYGLFLSPRVVPEGVRPEETRLGFSPGKLYYALSILALILIFHDRIHVAAAAWAILSLGDSTSNLAGRAWGKKVLPWSRDKTWVGSLVFIFSSWAGSLVLFYWTSAGGVVEIPDIYRVVLSCGAASAFAALVESLPLPLDDNITCPLAAGAVLGAML
jgi:dolichol kinase